MVQDLKDKGAVVRTTACADGTTRHETLTRLPVSITALTETTVLTPDENEPQPETVHLVLEKAPQTRYSMADMSRNCLPAALERTHKSIPTFVSSKQALICDGESEDSDMIARLMTPGHRKRRRITEGGSSKRMLI